MHGVAVSLHTVERAVAPLRREVLAQGLATVRFEPPSRRQLRIDFGSIRTGMAGEVVNAHLFMAAGTRSCIP